MSGHRLSPEEVHFHLTGEVPTPITAEDVWDRVAKLEFELRERHKKLELILAVNFLAVLAILYKLYF